MNWLLRAEWTKFRTVRGWVIGMACAALVPVLLGLFIAVNVHTSCSLGPVEVACEKPPLGPDGEVVEDRFYLMHRSLPGDGSITARITSMTGIVTYPPPNHNEIVERMVPWAKAGVIVKESTKPGSPYAAVLLTAAHGVRMQHNFTHDTAGSPGGGPRWLRLTRAGDTLSGYESADGAQWTPIGTAKLSGLAATVQIGLFVSSPSDLTVGPNKVGGSVTQARLTQATAVFDQVEVQGATGGPWNGVAVGDGAGQSDWERYHRPNGIVESAGTYTVSGMGDIAPSGNETPGVELTLVAVPIGLIIAIVVAVQFITAEYRKGLIRTTLVATPRRGRVLAAKGIVIGSAGFAAGLVAAGVTIPLCTMALRAGGTFIRPVPVLTELRIIVGVAALYSAAAVLALGLGTLFRRSAAVVVTSFAVIVLPYLAARFGGMPDGLAQWLLRLTPAAAFAIQQSVPEYAHVLRHYAPIEGYYPLAPLAGLALLVAYAVVALGLGVVRLRRRDA